MKSHVNFWLRAAIVALLFCLIVPAVAGGLATDADNDPLTYSLNNAPAGMSISNTGVISWHAPVTPQTLPITVQVSDGHHLVTQSYTLNVAASGNQPPHILSLPKGEGVVAKPYQYQLVASDADGDALSYSLTQAPSGMSISATGLIAEMSGVRSLIYDGTEVKEERRAK